MRTKLYVAIRFVGISFAILVFAAWVFDAPSKGPLRHDGLEGLVLAAALLPIAGPWLSRKPGRLKFLTNIWLALDLAFWVFAAVVVTVLRIDDGSMLQVSSRLAAIPYIAMVIIGAQVSLSAGETTEAADANDRSEPESSSRG